MRILLFNNRDYVVVVAVRIIAVARHADLALKFYNHLKHTLLIYLDWLSDVGCRGEQCRPESVCEPSTRLRVS